MADASLITVQEDIDHLFRIYAGQMVAVLSRRFGLDKLDAIEDAVQDAMIAALNNWPFAGNPNDPRAWLIQVAKNKLRDRLRREQKQVPVEEDGEPDLPAFQPEVSTGFAGELNEDQLRMIFACCHPAIAPDAQVALTLKTIGGFDVAEIASAFLASQDAVARMLSRAKVKLREHAITLEIPPPSELADRAEPVLKVIYLIFNEGYSATAGQTLIRADLCDEAIRLAEILAAHPVTGTPAAHALAALLLFQGARLSSRYDQRGDLLLLAEQDRSRWDFDRLKRGLDHFRRSAGGEELTNYHLEAEIAACHALAPDVSRTDWAQILSCYETLQARRFSPVVELNRIIVLAQLHGPQRGLEELERFEAERKLIDYNLIYLTKAHFQDELSRKNEARENYQRALELTRNEPMRRFLGKKLDGLDQITAQTSS